MVSQAEEVRCSVISLRQLVFLNNCGVPAENSKIAALLSNTMYTTHGTNMPTTKQRRKIKKSFSISSESDSFIRKTCKDRKSTSESETLDVLLGELMVIRQQIAIEAAYSDYYDSLTEEEVAEQQAWGAFAESQLAKEAR